MLLVEAQAEPALRASRAKIVIEAAEFLVGEIRRCFEVDEDSVARLRVTALIIVGGSHDLLAAWQHGALRMDRQELTDHIVEMLAAAIGATLEPRG